jgi:hypothetical protein
MENQPQNKSLDTLVKDIYGLFDPDQTHEPSEENLDWFCSSLKDLLRTRLASRQSHGTGLRFSALGKPDRQVWFDNHPDRDREEKLTAKTYFKFLYGDVIEQLVLFLAKESGHTVEEEQKEIEVNGVKGHIDAIIDGVVVDVKSASPFGYKKFQNNAILEEDPFGYVQQLAGYSDVLTPGQPGAWAAFNKVSGEICVSYLSPSIIKDYKPEPRIEHLKTVIALPEPPELCYTPVPDGKSGNMKLPTPCSYCKHKFRCHPGLRVFLYSTGPRFLTQVAKEPDVPELEKYTDTEED